jgi:hypothetical protein
MDIYRTNTYIFKVKFYEKLQKTSKNILEEKNQPKQILRVNPSDRGFTVKFCRFSAKNNGKYRYSGDFRELDF